jgi:hypothetical protein
VGKFGRLGKTPVPHNFNFFGGIELEKKLICVYVSVKNTIFIIMVYIKEREGKLPF